MLLNVLATLGMHAWKLLPDVLPMMSVLLTVQASTHVTIHTRFVQPMVTVKFIVVNPTLANMLTLHAPKVETFLLIASKQIVVLRQPYYVNTILNAA